MLCKDSVVDLSFRFHFAVSNHLAMARKGRGQLFPGGEQYMVEELDASDESEFCDSSDEEKEDDNAEKMTEGDVGKNYNLLESSVKAAPPIIVLSELRSKYPEAFTEQSEALLASVLEENPLGFQLTDFQVFFAFLCRKMVQL